MSTNYLLDTIYGWRISEALGRKLSSHPAVGPHIAPRTSGHPSPFTSRGMFGQETSGFWPMLPLVRGGWQPKRAKPASTCVLRCCSRGRPCLLWTSQTSCVSVSHVMTRGKSESLRSQHFCGLEATASS